MSLTPRLVAIQGIGFTAISLAVQGLLAGEVVTPPESEQSRRRMYSGGRIASGPDALLSMADYLKRFGKKSVLQAPAAAAIPASQRLRKRQRMEAEIFALMDF